MLFNNMSWMKQSWMIMMIMFLSSGIVFGFTTTTPTFIRYQSNNMMMMTIDDNNNMDQQQQQASSRRHFMNTMIGATMMSTVVGGLTTTPEYANAAASPEILTTPNGIKYAIIKPADEKRIPFDKDIVAIEYTGYLLDGSIFDSTHSIGKKNALAFAVGSPVVIDGINEMVKYMSVGEKVQAIIPPQLAFGDKGICIENGECLVKPKATLVYDIYLKRTAVPPP